VGAIAAQSALAAGGGGGGGSLPSSSAPAYDPAADYAKGSAALRAGNYREADRAFRRVLQATPRDVNTLVLSGVSKAGLGDFKGAAKAQEKALRIDPESLAARREYAIALAKLGEADKAAAELATLKAREAACGTSCPQAADLRAAVSAVEAATAATSGPAPAPGAALAPSLLLAGPVAGDGAYLAAISLINERRYAEALAALADAQAALGPHPDVLTYIGYTWRQMRDYDRAETYYRQALAIAPGHRGATEYYGELKAERGDLAGARAMLARLEQLCPFGCVEAEDLRRWIDARSL
jgi:tetratricopeptide (TPR) repeat protein